MADLEGDNPVIAAIDAGHLDAAGKCPVCREKFPCGYVARARRAARDRADRHSLTRGLDVPRFAPEGDRRYGS